MKSLVLLFALLTETAYSRSSTASLLEVKDNLQIYQTNSNGTENFRT